MRQHPLGKIDVFLEMSNNVTLPLDAAVNTVFTVTLLQPSKSLLNKISANSVLLNFLNEC